MKPLATVVLLAFCGFALAQDDAPKAPPAAPQAIDLSQIGALLGGGQIKAPGEEAKPFPDFAEVTKGMKSDPGFFTLWFHPPEQKDKDQEKLLCQVPARVLGEQFMLSTSMAGGGFLTGFPLDERVVKWEVLNKDLLLIEPETRYIVDRNKEVSDAVRRTYPERIRIAVPIVTKTQQGDPVIDLGPLLKSNFSGISMFSSFGPFGGGGGGGGINPMLSRWTKKKTFDFNVEVGVELAVGAMYPAGSYDKKYVHYSFWKLQPTDYQPRVADDRVGYFLTANQDWAKPTESRDLFNRYIDRWHLAKRDPQMPVCDARQNIIFYIEKTVPVRFRRAVREGILEWNKAYEKIGFLNAIEVRQQTDDNEWKDLDPEDMRYSFFRWIVTGAGFAMGPHRANPFTGQIYDADIIFDDSMVRFYKDEAQAYTTSALVAAKMRDIGHQQLLARLPQWLRPGSAFEPRAIGGEDNRSAAEHARKHLEERGILYCDHAAGIAHQLRLASAVLADQGKDVLDRVLFDAVKEVVMHEVGHTLGLRHNFKASSIYTLDEIKRRRKTGEATVGSVMDYNPTLLFSQGTTDGFFVTPTLGAYDYWAIEYGYRPFDATAMAAAKGAKKEDKKEEKPKEEKKPDTNGQPAPTPPAGAPGKPTVSMSELLKQVPKELLDQISPQMKEQIQQALAAGGGAIEMDGGSGPGAGGGKPGPSFVAPPSGEEGMLRTIASRSTEPELAYATDEDTTFVSPDPLSNRFDVGSDPMAWSRDRFELVSKRLENIMDWAVKDQESWYHLRRAYLTLVLEKMQVLDYVGRYIGGQYFHRAHKGETKAPSPFVLVEPEKQRAALRFIADHLFSDTFFALKPDVLNHLAPARWYHEGASMDVFVTFPVMEYISLIQWWNLVDRLAPPIISRIHDSELKTDAADRFTVAEYLQTLQKAVWSDATDGTRLSGSEWTDAKPFLSAIRRSLQREYLGIVEPIVRSRPGNAVSPDIHAMFVFNLQTLSNQLGESLRGRLDFASKAHLSACKSRIDRMLSSELREF